MATKLSPRAEAIQCVRVAPSSGEDGTGDHGIVGQSDEVRQRNGLILLYRAILETGKGNCLVEDKAQVATDDWDWRRNDQ